MTETVVIAPHPDDEVLGASHVLRAGPATVVHVTDGVPPWVEPDQVSRIRERRRRECDTAWHVLGANIASVVRLGLDDLDVWQHVDVLAAALTVVLDQFVSAAVHVPAYQNGHPDHDATFAAALLARRRSGDRHDWRVYGLYGYDRSGRLAFGSLDADDYPGVATVGVATTDLESKAAALRHFTSQLHPGSVLHRWLQTPRPEADAPLPDTFPEHDPGCFYETELDFARHGVTAAMVHRTLQRAVRPKDDAGAMPGPEAFGDRSGTR